MGDRVVVLHQGVVRQIGTPTEVYDSPADTFVATFLGSPPMNLLENGDAIVGFRPEHLVPEDRVTRKAIGLKLRTVNTEYLGSEWIYYGRVEGEHFADKAVTARLPDASAFEIGELYDFAVSEVHLRFFDKKTQRRTEARSMTWQ